MYSFFRISIYFTLIVCILCCVDNSKHNVGEIQILMHGNNTVTLIQSLEGGEKKVIELKDHFFKPKLGGFMNETKDVLEQKTKGTQRIVISGHLLDSARKGTTKGIPSDIAETLRQLIDILEPHKPSKEKQIQTENKNENKLGSSTQMVGSPKIIRKNIFRYRHKPRTDNSPTNNLIKKEISDKRQRPKETILGSPLLSIEDLVFTRESMPGKVSKKTVVEKSLKTDITDIERTNTKTAPESSNTAGKKSITTLASRNGKSNTDQIINALPTQRKNNNEAISKSSVKNGKRSYSKAEISEIKNDFEGYKSQNRITTKHGKNSKQEIMHTGSRRSKENETNTKNKIGSKINDKKANKKGMSKKHKSLNGAVIKNTKKHNIIKQWDFGDSVFVKHFLPKNKLRQYFPSFKNSVKTPYQTPNKPLSKVNTKVRTNQKEETKKTAVKKQIMDSKVKTDKWSIAKPNTRKLTETKSGDNDNRIDSPLLKKKIENAMSKTRRLSHATRLSKKKVLRKNIPDAIKSNPFLLSSILEMNSKDTPKGTTGNTLVYVDNFKDILLKRLRKNGKSYVINHETMPMPSTTTPTIHVLSKLKTLGSNKTEDKSNLFETQTTAPTRNKAVKSLNGFRQPSSDYLLNAGGLSQSLSQQTKVSSSSAAIVPKVNDNIHDSKPDLAHSHYKPAFKYADFNKTEVQKQSIEHTFSSVKSRREKMPPKQFLDDQKIIKSIEFIHPSAPVMNTMDKSQTYGSKSTSKTLAKPLPVKNHQPREKIMFSTQITRRPLAPTHIFSGTQRNTYKYKSVNKPYQSLKSFQSSKRFPSRPQEPLTQKVTMTAAPFSTQNYQTVTPYTVYGQKQTKRPVKLKSSSKAYHRDINLLSNHVDYNLPKNKKTRFFNKKRQEKPSPNSIDHHHFNAYHSYENAPKKKIESSVKSKLKHKKQIRPGSHGITKPFKMLNSGVRQRSLPSPHKIIANRKHSWQVINHHSQSDRMIQQNHQDHSKHQNHFDHQRHWDHNSKPNQQTPTMHRSNSHNQGFSDNHLQSHHQTNSHHQSHSSHWVPTNNHGHLNDQTQSNYLHNSNSQSHSNNHGYPNNRRENEIYNHQSHGGGPQNNHRGHRDNQFHHNQFRAQKNPHSSHSRQPGTTPTTTIPKHVPKTSISWKTRAGNGMVFDEYAKVQKNKDLIYIISDRVPSTSGLQKSSTLMDFHRKKMIIRFDVSDFGNQVCFVTDTKSTYPAITKELKMRSSSKTLDMGEGWTYYAERSTKLKNLNRVGGRAFYRFCKNAILANNVYELVADPMGDSGPLSFKASGLVSASEPGFSIPMEIILEEQIDLQRKSQKTHG